MYILFDILVKFIYMTKYGGKNNIILDDIALFKSNTQPSYEVQYAGVCTSVLRRIITPWKPI